MFTINILDSGNSILTKIFEPEPESKMLVPPNKHCKLLDWEIRVVETVSIRIVRYRSTPLTDPPLDF